MRHFKSERLKKLEAELQDLEQWLKLGLVPKKDMIKHEAEIANIKEKIEEEKERLQYLKDSGDWEEYTTPKRAHSRSGYTEMPTIPDLGGEVESNSNSTQTTEYAEEETESSTTSMEDEDSRSDDTDTGSYFGSRRRWDGIVDPDADDW